MSEAKKYTIKILANYIKIKIYFNEITQLIAGF